MFSHPWQTRVVLGRMKSFSYRSVVTIQGFAMWGPVAAFVKAVTHAGGVAKFTTEGTLLTGR
jgi:hypothetical protein